MPLWAQFPFQGPCCQSILKELPRRKWSFGLWPWLLFSVLETPGQHAGAWCSLTSCHQTCSGHIVSASLIHAQSTDIIQPYSTTDNFTWVHFPHITYTTGMSLSPKLVMVEWVLEGALVPKPSLKIDSSNTGLQLALISTVVLPAPMLLPLHQSYSRLWPEKERLAISFPVCTF